MIMKVMPTMHSQFVSRLFMFLISTVIGVIHLFSDIVWQSMGLSIQYQRRPGIWYGTVLTDLVWVRTMSQSIDILVIHSLKIKRNHWPGHGFDLIARMKLDALPVITPSGMVSQQTFFLKKDCIEDMKQKENKKGLVLELGKHIQQQSAIKKPSTWLFLCTHYQSLIKWGYFNWIVNLFLVFFCFDLV